MAEDLSELFARLRRDVVADIVEGIGRRIDAEIAAFRDDMNSHFQMMHERFDRLERFQCTEIEADA